MREVNQEEMKIRRFLLHDLGEAERERLEELFLTDSTFRDRVLMVESELVDEYLEGELDQTETEKFLQVFEASPVQLRKLRIAQSIRDYARQEYGNVVPKRRKTYIYIAIAATILLIIFSGIWLMRRTQFERYAAQERDRHAQIERQLIAANAAATSESPELRVTQLVLAPVSTRGLGPESSLSLNSGAEAFDLWLQPTVTEYETYSAVLKRAGTSDQFNVPGLRLQVRDQGKMVKLRVPARSFGRGIYEISLITIAPDGQLIDAGRFTFQFTY